MGLLSKIKEAFSQGAVQRDTPLPPQRDFSQWSQQFQDRQAQFPQPEHDVGFTFTAPTLINLIADLHIGHPTTNYKRIEDEINAISSTPNSEVIMAGDLIDNMNWNPGQFQEMEQTPEQIGFLRSVLQHLANQGKLLHHIQGDHDGWLQKSGMDIQQELPAMGVSVSTGPTYFHLNVEDQHYEMAGAHQLPGHSIYNQNHPQMRAARFGSMHGAEVIFSGHNHKKGIAQSYTHELGVPTEVTYVALGPYKATDEWLSKKGWPAQKPDEMFGISVYFDGETHDIVANMDIVEANHLMKPLLKPRK